MNDKIAEELITYKFSGKETLNSLMDIFREIMKKYNISQTDPVYNGKGKIIGANGNRFEWTMYKTLWLDSIQRWIDWKDIFCMGEE